ncbi:MAG: hypothetical protein KDC87_02295 [Planctomycetes bacterium]|nr:hypothetical protein [Planctomycetota bacterium]MCB9872217.1 hypothetical protein [Planctomycetota bacterium]
MFRHPQLGLSTAALCLLAGATAAQHLHPGSSSPSGLTGGYFASELYFAAGDPTTGVELWRYTGTSARRVLDILPGPASSYPDEIVRDGLASSGVWFVARDANGRELHHYPALKGAATTRVLDIRNGRLGSHPAELTVVGKLLFFTADDGVHGRELWSSDGTITGTGLVADLVAGATSSQPHGLIEHKGKLYFAATTPTTGTELFVSDGTPAGTGLVLDIEPGAASSCPGGLTSLGNEFYFAATTKRYGRELWSSDGSKAGTALSEDIDPGAASSSPDQLVAGLQLAFTARQGLRGRQLFLKSPTGKATMFSALKYGASISQITPGVFTVWFRARTDAAGHELWQTTSTGGSAMVHDLRPGVLGSMPANLVPLGSSGLLFRANNGSSGVELWQTDGKNVGLVRDIRVGVDDAHPSRPIAFGLLPTTFLFAAKERSSGIELWKYDGANVSQVLDIDPRRPLPEMHVGLANLVLTAAVRDATPGAPAVFGIGTVLSAPQLFPFLRGALVIDLQQPNLLLPYRVSTIGRADLAFQLPPNGIGGIPLVYQSFIEASSSPFQLDATPSSSCTEGTNATPTPNGGQARGSVCLDDESGEYQISATRLDANPTTTYIGVYRVRSDPTEPELLFCFPLEVGDTVDREGRLEFKVRLVPQDATGETLEMHIFDAPPGPESPTKNSFIVASYC